MGTPDRATSPNCHAKTTQLIQQSQVLASSGGPTSVPNTSVAVWISQVTAQVETMESLLPCLDGGVALADFSHWKPQVGGLVSLGLFALPQRKTEEKARNKEYV